jgi:hypothetical protein
MSISTFNIIAQNTLWFIDGNYNPTIDLIKGMLLVAIILIKLDTSSYIY